MREVAKQLKQRYDKVPVFMIYLFLLVNKKGFIKHLIIFLSLLGILAMLFVIILSIVHIIYDGYNYYITLCISVLLLVLLCYSFIDEKGGGNDVD